MVTRLDTVTRVYRYTLMSSTIVSCKKLNPNFIKKKAITDCYEYTPITDFEKGA